MFMCEYPLSSRLKAFGVVVFENKIFFLAFFLSDEKLHWTALGCTKVHEAQRRSREIFIHFISIMENKQVTKGIRFI